MPIFKQTPVEKSVPVFAFSCCNFREDAELDPMLKQNINLKRPPADAINSDLDQPGNDENDDDITVTEVPQSKVLVPPDGG